ncbi:MAG: HD domain-containing protein [Actinomycetota bacterium]|nr:HD domain-containing protein [Actinomycetota bacterium]
MPEQRVGDDRLGVLQEQLLHYARDLRGALDRTQATVAELSRTHLETVAALAAAIDVRDAVTGGHVYRVAHYGIVLARHLAPQHAADPQLVYGFLLHDIGKLGVPDGILMKPGRLTEAEQTLMRRHVTYGVRFVEQVSFLQPALQVVATHHEAFDGSGYPRGLARTDISLVTRMFGVCDAFDAMVHDRPYRPAMSVEEAVEELRAGAGAQFDPEVVAGFLEILDRIVAVEDRPELPDVDVTPSPARLRPLWAQANLVFDALDDGMLLVSPDGVIRDANRACLELFGLAAPPVGLTVDELIDRSETSLTDASLARLRAAAAPEALLDGRSEDHLNLETADQGRLRQTAHTLREEDGTVTGRLLVFHRV